ncbi:yeats family-domain-containing protein [Zopfochytrium polystomum]|nr:yeats family-domain-containing protein [Zopfochytrium polystomum]
MKRVKNVAVPRPIVYGSYAASITKKDPPPNDPSHTHRWTVYVRGLNGEDLGYFIKKVSFKLHESFIPQNRIIDRAPFEVTETGWGEFEIQIKIQFQDPQEKPLMLFHQLQLYPKDDSANATVKKPVIAEKYDEIVFNEPTEDMFKILNSHPLVSGGKKPTHGFTVEAEAEEAMKYATINERILAETEAYKARLMEAEEAIKTLQEEIRAMEQS